MRFTRSMGLACCVLWGCAENADPAAAPALDADSLDQALHDAQLDAPPVPGAHASAHPQAAWWRGAFPGGHGHFHHRHHKPEKPPQPPTTVCGAPLSLVEIVGDGGEWRIGAAAPALDNHGSLALVATDNAGAPQLLLGSGGAIAAVNLAASGLEPPVRVMLDDAGNLAFLAATPSSAGLLGVFTTDAAGSSVMVQYAAEAGGGLADGGSIITARPLALAPNGTLAFSSIVNGSGALYRGAITGSATVVRTGSGDFFNQQDIDVNAAGTVAMEMEHAACGLQRGILLFDTPEPAIADIDKAIAGLSVAQQPDVAINDAGVVAFALTGSTPTEQILRCPAGQPSERFSVATGVYTALRTPLSDPPNLVLVVDNSGPFASFGSVDIDTAGSVVFEADLAAGGRGIFQGPDPVLDKIVAVGDVLNGEVVTAVQLGQLNDACQLSFATTSASGRRVWRADGISD